MLSKIATYLVRCWNINSRLVKVWVMSRSLLFFLKSTMLMLLLASLGIRALVPVGLMVAATDQGLAIILCDSSSGLGSVPAFRKQPSQDVHQHHVHAKQAGATAIGHHESDQSCEECDFLWANGFEEVDHFIVITGISKPVPFNWQARQISRFGGARAPPYHSRAPPSASFS